MLAQPVSTLDDLLTVVRRYELCKLLDFLALGDKDKARSFIDKAEADGWSKVEMDLLRESLESLWQDRSRR